MIFEGDQPISLSYAQTNDINKTCWIVPLVPKATIKEKLSNNKIREIPVERFWKLVEPCEICKTLTHWYMPAWKIHICSEECVLGHKKWWNEFGGINHKFVV
jgi:hypothetical protein